MSKKDIQVYRQSSNITIFAPWLDGWGHLHTIIYTGDTAVDETIVQLKERYSSFGPKVACISSCTCFKVFIFLLLVSE